LMLYRASIRNNPFIGIYVAAGGGVALVPPAAPRGFTLRLEGLLGLKVAQSTIGGVSAVGTMSVMNSHGIAVPAIISEEELSALKGVGSHIGIVESKLNCLGNLVCANDRRAIASPALPPEAIAALSDALGVEVSQLTIAGHGVVGSLAVATDSGALVHPLASKSEVDELRELLQVKVDVGTVNGGFKCVRAGIIWGPKGALVGEATTGPEMMIIQEVLSPPGDKG
jgi:translation initiation factor 6